MHATAFTVAGHLHAGAAPNEGTSRIATYSLSHTHHLYTHPRTAAYTNARAQPFA